MPLPIVQRAPVIAHAAQAQQVLVAGGINRHVAQALATRGVDRVQHATGAYGLEHYKSLKGLENFTQILADAIEKGQPLMVVADYDCDGATACTVAYTGLKALGAKVDYLVPNRFIHGYGLTPSVVDLVAEARPRPQWIITVDNGIASIDGVKAANALGIGVLVTDHHLPLPSGELPDAAAIVNPNQPGCTFPSKNLAGVGVMYYVLAATRDLLIRRGKLVNAVELGHWLDVVALGTVADVVKLDPNNRWLVRKGLARIRAGHARPGVRALFDISNRPIVRASSQDFGFSVGPRINAAGRLEDMTIGIRCLVSQNDEVADNIAQELFDLNERRKEIERGMKDDAVEDIDLSGQEGCFTRVVFGEAYHEGVIGIVAGRIKEEANTPVVAFAPAEDGIHLKGSARSIPGLHLRDALDLVHKRGDNLLVKFGGHAMAAGMTLKRENLDRFKTLFEQVVHELMGGELQQKVLTVDGELPDAAITVDTAEALADQPWGQGFEVPIWTGEFTIVDARLVGKERNHLKMTVERNGQRYSAMQFFTTEEPDQAHVLLAYQLSVNEFRGNRSADLIVVDRRNA